MSGIGPGVRSRGQVQGSLRAIVKGLVRGWVPVRGLVQGWVPLRGLVRGSVDAAANGTARPAITRQRRHQRSRSAQAVREPTISSNASDANVFRCTHAEAQPMSYRSGEPPTVATTVDIYLNCWCWSSTPLLGSHSIVPVCGSRSCAGGLVATLHPRSGRASASRRPTRATRHNTTEHNATRHNATQHNNNNSNNNNNNSNHNTTTNDNINTTNNTPKTSSSE